MGGLAAVATGPLRHLWTIHRGRIANRPDDSAIIVLGAGPGEATVAELPARLAPRRSFPPPTLRERGHRGLASRLEAVRRAAYVAVRPHPLPILRHAGRYEDPTTCPFSSTSSRSRSTAPTGARPMRFEDEAGHRHAFLIA